MTAQTVQGLSACSVAFAVRLTCSMISENVMIWVLSGALSVRVVEKDSEEEEDPGDDDKEIEG